MNLVELTQYTNDEESAEGYLRAQGILKTYEECPHCGSKRINTHLSHVSTSVSGNKILSSRN